MTSYGLVIIFCMTLWGIYRNQGRDMISIHVLPGATFVVGFSFYLVRSIVLLVLYGRAGKDAEFTVEETDDE